MIPLYVICLPALISYLQLHVRQTPTPALNQSVMFLRIELHISVRESFNRLESPVTTPLRAIRSIGEILILNHPNSSSRRL